MDQLGIHALAQSGPRFAQKVQQCACSRPLRYFESLDVIAAFGMELMQVHQCVLKPFVLVQNGCEPSGTQFPADHCRADLFVDAQRFFKMLPGIVPIAIVAFQQRLQVQRAALLETISDRRECPEASSSESRAFCYSARLCSKRSPIVASCPEASSSESRAFCLSLSRR